MLAEVAVACSALRRAQSSSGSKLGRKDQTTRVARARCQWWAQGISVALVVLRAGPAGSERPSCTLRTLPQTYQTAHCESMPWRWNHWNMSELLWMLGLVFASWLRLTLRSHVSAVPLKDSRLAGWWACQFDAGCGSNQDPCTCYWIAWPCKLCCAPVIRMPRHPGPCGLASQG